MLFCVTHGGNLGLRELDSAARVIAELADPAVNTIWGTVVDPKLGDEVNITVIATGFPPRAMQMDDPREIHRIRDLGMAGINSHEDADMPAFLRRNIRSMNSVERGAMAKLAERR